LNLRKFRREEISVNLTPLIDVVFLLLIFFMVTTTFRDESEIEIDLPQASEKPMELVVNTQLDTLKRALRKAKGERDNPPIIISADANTPHQSVVTAMDAARQLGLVRMSIATRNQGDQ
jgi:biopolymer transport protein ExbD